MEELYWYIFNSECFCPKLQIAHSLTRETLKAFTMASENFWNFENFALYIFWLNWLTASVIKLKCNRFTWLFSSYRWKSSCTFTWQGMLKNSKILHFCPSVPSSGLWRLLLVFFSYVKWNNEMINWQWIITTIIMMLVDIKAPTTCVPGLSVEDKCMKLYMLRAVH